MKKTIIPLLIVPCLFAHDPEKERLGWAQYYRMGAVYSETSTTGIAGYARLKRTTAYTCLLYTSPSPRDLSTSRMPSSA